MIAHREDIQVGRPLERETLRAVEEGVLVTCTDSYCQWQGLFPGVELAKRAVESHYDHERVSIRHGYAPGVATPSCFGLGERNFT